MQPMHPGEGIAVPDHVATPGEVWEPPKMRETKASVAWHRSCSIHSTDRSKEESVHA